MPVAHRTAAEVRLVVRNLGLVVDRRIAEAVRIGFDLEVGRTEAVAVGRIRQELDWERRIDLEAARWEEHRIVIRVFGRLELGWALRIDLEARQMGHRTTADRNAEAVGCSERRIDQKLDGLPAEH